ncbi:PilZ domain-containing protein [Sphingomonas sp. ASV193]|uniref:PilZ domain-containing protein n=1 Tax=Sphingomonas sp. ASV193 TaxID=3144405 RepID=UPI0032E90B9C
MSSDPFADRRAAPRVTVALPGFMTVAGRRSSVQLLDVSAGGAKLATAEALAAGTVVDLDCGTVRRQATVRWGGGGTVGVSFDRDLDARETAALVERSTALAARMHPAG